MSKASITVFVPHGTKLCNNSLSPAVTVADDSAIKVLPEKACAIYECSINQKGMKGCGECEHVPCEIWRRTKDPSYTEEEFERSIQERVERLKTVTGSPIKG